MEKLEKYFAANKYQLLGHVCMLLLLVLATVYANVRVLLTDSAYQLFYDINNPGVLINDSRYSMVLSQILPWLAIHLHLPLKLVVVSYSVSFILVGYACWLVTAFAMGQRKAATLMLFVLLGIGGTFLHCISESFQLMFYVPMLYAWMCLDAGKARVGRIGYYVILALLVALAFFIYPMAVFYILFAVGFRLLKDGKPKVDVPALATVGFLVLYIILYWAIGPSGHDSEFVPTGAVIIDSLRHFFELGSFNDFLILFPRLYLPLILLLILTLVGYVRGRNWWKLAYVAGYVACFFVATCIIYQKGDSYISRERYFLPLAFIIGLALLEDELPRLTNKQEWCFYAVFVLLLGYSFGRIIHYVHRYEPRLEAVTKVATMAESQGQHKLLVTRSTAEEIFPLDIWGLAIESMLLTAQQGPEHTVTIYKEDDDFDRTNDDLYNNPDCYVVVNWWKQWWVKDLNPRYFYLPPQGYKELKVECVLHELR